MEFSVHHDTYYTYYKGVGGSPGLQQLPRYYTAQCTGQGARSSIADANSFPTAEVSEA